MDWLTAADEPTVWEARIRKHADGLLRLQLSSDDFEQKCVHNGLGNALEELAEFAEKQEGHAGGIPSEEER